MLEGFGLTKTPYRLSCGQHAKRVPLVYRHLHFINAVRQSTRIVNHTRGNGLHSIQPKIFFVTCLEGWCGCNLARFHLRSSGILDMDICPVIGLQCESNVEAAQGSVITNRQPIGGVIRCKRGFYTITVNVYRYSVADQSDPLWPGTKLNLVIQLCGEGSHWDERRDGLHNVDSLPVKVGRI